MRQVTIKITEDDRGKVSVRQDGPEDARLRFNNAEIMGLLTQFIINRAANPQRALDIRNAGSKCSNCGEPDCQDPAKLNYQYGCPKWVPMPEIKVGPKKIETETHG